MRYQQRGLRNQEGNGVGAKREAGLGERLSGMEEFCTGAVPRVKGGVEKPQPRRTLHGRRWVMGAGINDSPCPFLDITQMSSLFYSS